MLGRREFALLAVLGGCSFDSEEPAPYLAPPHQQGLCGTTATLFPKLLEFVKQDRFAGLRTFIERHLIPTEVNPRPSLSLRTLIGALVELISSVGLDETANTVEVAASSEALKNVEPLVLSLLRFISGELGGPDRYATGDAAAHFVRVCNPDHLLLAIESLLTLRSPSHDDRLWLEVLSKEAFVLIEDPFFEPFLQTFEREAAVGRPAIVALFAQIMNFIRQPDFHISRVETLLESVVYPNVNEALRNKLVRLVDLLGEATSPRAGILVPLQRAIDCGMAHPPERDALIGFAYDFVTDDAVGLRGLLDSVEGLVSTRDSERFIGILADTIHGIRLNQDSRDDLLELIARLLSRPDNALVIPTLTALIEDGVIFELLDALAKLLGGCGRAL